MSELRFSVQGMFVFERKVYFYRIGKRMVPNTNNLITSIHDYTFTSGFRAKCRPGFEWI